MNLEFFSCSGGMAEGFRRAGITFDMVVDWDPDACASYEANLGTVPWRMDARDLARMLRLGWQPAGGVDLIVADPPCTPWSRAGKRQGTGDDRDMLLVTVEIIRMLRPRAYLIGNVPGLDDAPNWPTLQRALAPLGAAGYCIADYAALDAADFGVPQHRVRPFWFGHLEGPCVRWPAPTHGDPDDPSVHSPLPGLGLPPWVTCRQALGHLPPDELGRPVRLRSRAQHSVQHGSVPGKPARVVGTSNLSDGNVLVPEGNPASHLRRKTPRTPQSERGLDADEPARTVRATRTWGAGQLTTNERHPINTLDAPSFTLATKGNMQGAQGAACLALSSPPEKPKRGGSSQGEQWSRVHSPDAPAPTVLTDTDRATGNGVKLEWPWDRPATTVQRDERMAPPGHKPEDWGNIMSAPDAVLLSERAAAILQGFPEGWTFSGKTKTARWSQLGQAMPPALAEAVARAVRVQMGRK